MDEALQEAETIDEHFYEPELYRLKGELLLELAPERIVEARAALSRAAAVARAQQATSFEQRTTARLRRLD